MLIITKVDEENNLVTVVETEGLEVREVKASEQLGQVLTLKNTNTNITP